VIPPAASIGRNAIASPHFRHQRECGDERPRTWPPASNPCAIIASAPARFGRGALPSAAHAQIHFHPRSDLQAGMCSAGFAQTAMTADIGSRESSKLPGRKKRDQHVHDEFGFGRNFSAAAI